MKADPKASRDLANRGGLNGLAELGAVFTHEINNLLATIGIALEAAKLEYSDEELRSDPIAQSLTAGEQAVQQLTDVARRFRAAIREVPPGERQPAALGPLAEAVIGAFQPRLLEHDLSLDLSALDPDLRIACDPARLFQALELAISDSIESERGSEERTIALSAIRGAERIEIRIRTSAPLPDPKQFAEALDPRAALKATEAGRPVSRLGLLQRLIEADEGRLSLDPAAGNRTLLITFPVRTHEKA